MSDRERTERLLKEFIRGAALTTAADDERVKQLFDGIISMVKGECCSGKLKWEPSPFLLSRPGWSVPEECGECFLEHFSKSEPGCLKPGCLREQKINSAPQLIQGYTAEQWQEIKKGGYLCEVRDGEDEDWYEGLIKVVSFDDDGGVYGKQGFYNFCRPAQIKGVMRPIFVEPVDDPYCVFFDVDGKAMHHGMMRWSLLGEYNFKALNCDRVPTKYIEL